MECSSTRGGVYKIINTLNGKCYVGSTANFKHRCAVHQRMLRANKHHSPSLQGSWNKYGERAFTFEILEELSDFTKLIPREQYWIDKLKPAFNWGPVAGSPLGIKRSPEYKDKLSQAMLTYFHGHINPAKGKTHTEASKAAFSQGHKGKPLSAMGHKEDCTCAVCKTRRGEVAGILHPRYLPREERSCECGCETAFICPTNSPKRFVSGHNVNLRYK